MEEFSYAKLEGVGFEMMKSPVEIRDDGVVFAAGDVAHGASTVVESGETGKRVAGAMHAYMQSLPMPEPSAYADAPVVEPVASSVLAEQKLTDHS